MKKIKRFIITIFILLVIVVGGGVVFLRYKTGSWNSVIYIVKNPGDLIEYNRMTKKRDELIGNAKDNLEDAEITNTIEIDGTANGIKKVFDQLASEEVSFAYYDTDGFYQKALYIPEYGFAGVYKDGDTYIWSTAENRYRSKFNKIGVASKGLKYVKFDDGAEYAYYISKPKNSKGQSYPKDDGTETLSYIIKFDEFSSKFDEFDVKEENISFENSNFSYSGAGFKGISSNYPNEVFYSDGKTFLTWENEETNTHVSFILDSETISKGKRQK